MKRILTKEQAANLRAKCSELRREHNDWTMPHVLSEGLNRLNLTGKIKISTSAATRYVGLRKDKPKRAYTRRKPDAAPAPVPEPPALKYCPECGYPIAVHLAAYRTAKRIMRKD